MLELYGVMIMILAIFFVRFLRRFPVVVIVATAIAVYYFPSLWFLGVLVIIRIVIVAIRAINNLENIHDQ